MKIQKLMLSYVWEYVSHIIWLNLTLKYKSIGQATFIDLFLCYGSNLPQVAWARLPQSGCWSMWPTTDGNLSLLKVKRDPSYHFQKAQNRVSIKYPSLWLHRLQKDTQKNQYILLLQLPKFNFRMIYLMIFNWNWRIGKQRIWVWTPSYLSYRSLTSCQYIRNGCTPEKQTYGINE